MITKQIRPQTLTQYKENAEKFAMLTAYDYGMSKRLSEADIPVILVGDSLGNMFAGQSDTLAVTVEDMIYHTRAVIRGAGKSLVVVDMPFMSYQVSVEKAKENAGRLVKEGGAHAVKLEVDLSYVETVKAIISMGIPVMAHIGFTPQAIHQLGGYKIQGKTDASYTKIIETAKAMEKAGCFAVLLELVPHHLAETVTQQLTIPTIGIGAGPKCDGQVLVTQDILGLTHYKAPSFAKQYANIGEMIQSAITAFKTEVEAQKFPESDH